MVEKADAEFVSETININRLYHRELIARLDKIDELEKKFNCKITFPSTEEASDIVTVSGPEYQVPLAVDEFLVSQHVLSMVEDTQLTVLGHGSRITRSRLSRRFRARRASPLR
jgi:hypothetical protein